MMQLGFFTMQFLLLCSYYLDHGGDRMDPTHVLDDALRQVRHAQTDGPVGVAFQLDHLVGAATQSSTSVNICTAAACVFY